jgi:hypothetical protein
MKQYSKSLDLLLTASQFALNGNHEKAAKFFTQAMAQKDLKTTLIALDKLQGANLEAAKTIQTAANKTTTRTPTASGRVATFLAEKAKAKGKMGKDGKPKKVQATEDEFNSVMDDMTEEDADLDDILELPVSGTDNGNGESDLDVGNDDASDLDFSPTESLNLADLDDLRDLDDDDFGSDDLGEEASTTGEGDVDDRDPIVQCSDDLPEGEEAEDIGKPDKAEDTDLVTPGGGGGGNSKGKAGDKSEARVRKIKQMNRVNRNLAALQNMTSVTQAARVALARKAK